MAGITKTDFTKQTAHINTFNMGSAPLKKNVPQQLAQAKSLPSQSEFAFSQSQTASQPSEQQQNTPNAKPFKNKKTSNATKRRCTKETFFKATTNQTTLLQVFANRKTSLNNFTTRIPEDQPTNMEVKLILVLLILPQ